MKKKLLLVTGAGASIDFGFPSVADIDEHLAEHTGQIYKNLCNFNPYTYLKLCAGCKRDGTAFNYEELLYLMERIESFGDASTPDPTRNLFPLDSAYCRALPSIYGHLRPILIDELLDYMRKRSRVWMKDQQKLTKFQKFKRFLSTIEGYYDISFVTTNYDNILTQHFPYHNTGFDNNGTFQRAHLYNNSKWNKGIYLHGSVHFDMPDKRGSVLHKIYWKDKLPLKSKQNSFGRSKSITAEGHQILTSVIIAGLDKTNQILKEPFLQYYMLLDRLIFEADAILFIGYGFNDRHLNNVFSALTAKRIHKKKVVVIDFKDDKENPMEYACNVDWNANVQDTLLFDSQNLKHKDPQSGKERSIPTCPRDLKRKKILEYAKGTHHDVALWYDGLMSACDHADRIMKHL